MARFKVVSILKEAGATVMPRSLLFLLLTFSCTPPGHPNSARLHQPQGEAKSTPELEQAVREYAKNGNLDKLMAILEAKIANLDAADTAVSMHGKLKATYLEHSHIWPLCCRLTKLVESWCWAHR